MKEFQFALATNAPQYHYGLVKYFAFSQPFFGTLGIEYTQQTQMYSINMTYPQTGESTPGKYELTYTAKSISVPIGISARMGILDVNSGLLARYNFQAKASGDHMMDITTRPSNTEFGWHTGAGINLGPVRFGVNYQSTFTRDGSNLQHRGKNLEMRSVPGQFSFSMGIPFKHSFDVIFNWQF
jgi:hypothetical protein